MDSTDKRVLKDELQNSIVFTRFLIKYETSSDHGLALQTILHQLLVVKAQITAMKVKKVRS